MGSDRHRKLLRWLRRYYRVRRTGGGHLKVYGPRGFVVMSSSPSCPRAVDNAIKDLSAHAGIRVPKKL